eukprot:18618-Heterococcus_DN1.PRE.1
MLYVRTLLYTLLLSSRTLVTSSDTSYRDEVSTTLYVLLDRMPFLALHIRPVQAYTLTSINGLRPAGALLQYVLQRSER